MASSTQRDGRRRDHRRGRRHHDQHEQKPANNDRSVGLYSLPSATGVSPLDLSLGLPDDMSPIQKQRGRARPAAEPAPAASPAKQNFGWVDRWAAAPVRSPAAVAREVALTETTGGTGGGADGLQLGAAAGSRLLDAAVAGSPVAAAALLRGGVGSGQQQQPHQHQQQYQQQYQPPPPLFSSASVPQPQDYGGDRHAFAPMAASSPPASPAASSAERLQPAAAAAAEFGAAEWEQAVAQVEVERLRQKLRKLGRAHRKLTAAHTEQAEEIARLRAENARLHGLTDSPRSPVHAAASAAQLQTAAAGFPVPVAPAANQRCAALVGWLDDVGLGRYADGFVADGFGMRLSHASPPPPPHCFSFVAALA
eukprot:SAG22_NODE_3114_length_1929_cov_1.188525_1_plen_366_part_00